MFEDKKDRLYYQKPVVKPIQDSFGDSDRYLWGVGGSRDGAVAVPAADVIESLLDTLGGIVGSHNAPDWVNELVAILYLQQFQKAADESLRGNDMRVWQPRYGDAHGCPGYLNNSDLVKHAEVYSHKVGTVGNLMMSYDMDSPYRRIGIAWYSKLPEKATHFSNDYVSGNANGCRTPSQESIDRLCDVIRADHDIMVKTARDAKKREKAEARAA